MEQPQGYTQPSTERKKPALAVIFLVVAGCLVVGFFAVIILAAVLFPVFSQARTAARRASCTSNIKALAAGIRMYSDDYDARYPPAESWSQATAPYWQKDSVLICPENQGVPGYAFNSLLDSLPSAYVERPGEQPVLFESSAGVDDANDPLLSFIGRHRYQGTMVGNISRADGAVGPVGSAPAADAGGILSDNR